MAKLIQLTFDAHSPQDLALFWADVLGYVVDPPPGAEVADQATTLAAWEKFLDEANVAADARDSAFAIIDPEGKGPRLYYQRVPEPKIAKNRLHIDVRTASELRGDERMAALETEAERLVARGATRLQRFEPEPPMSHGFIVMADPEGNEFCLD